MDHANQVISFFGIKPNPAVRRMLKKQLSGTNRAESQRYWLPLLCPDSNWKLYLGRTRCWKIRSRGPISYFKAHVAYFHSPQEQDSVGRSFRPCSECRLTLRYEERDALDGIKNRSIVLCKQEVTQKEKEDDFPKKKMRSSPLAILNPRKSLLGGRPPFSDEGLNKTEPP